MIVELRPFDLITAPKAKLLASGGVWKALPRLVPVGDPSARLIAVTDTLSLDYILEGFRERATPEDFLPPRVLALRMEYEDFLRHSVQAVRYLRVFLRVRTTMSQDALVRMLHAHGVEALPLQEEFPRPFERGKALWEAVQAEDGTFWGLLRTRKHQAGILHPRLLHTALLLDFPLYLALEIHTFPMRQIMRILRTKRATLNFSAKDEDKGMLQQGIYIYHHAIQNGDAVHSFRLYVAYPASSLTQVRERAEILRGALPLELERVLGPAELFRRLFADEDLPYDELPGTPVTTPGAALLAGSLLSFRRRTEHRGVMLGVDAHQSPVVLDIFDDRNPSYNTVVLGQTGAGKTFSVLLLMLRHLLLGVRLVIIDPQGNVDLGFLGEEAHRAVLGQEGQTINVLDVVQEELPLQVEIASALLRILGVVHDDLEKAVLDRVLKDLYRRVWGGQGPSPLLSDLYEALEQEYHRASPTMRPIIERMMVGLEPYVTGSLAPLFGQETRVDLRLEHAVNVYDVSRLPQEGNLRQALLTILVAHINHAIRRRRRQGDRAPILFFVDEMGILMRDPVIAAYVSAEYKTARARLVGMIVADQDLHSLLGPVDPKTGLHHGIPILANAANTFIFKQKDSELARIREHFPMLPEELVQRLPLLPQGTCVARLADGDLLLVHVLPSRLERVLLSSRLQDREQARRIMEEIETLFAGGNGHGEG